MKIIKYILTVISVIAVVATAFFLPDFYYNFIGTNKNKGNDGIRKISIADNLADIPSPYEVCEALSDNTYNRMNLESDKTAEEHRRDAIKIFNDILSVNENKSDLFNTFLNEMETMDIYISYQSVCTSFDQKTGEVRTFYMYHVSLSSKIGGFDILYDKQNMFAYEISIMIDGNDDFSSVDRDETEDFVMKEFSLVAEKMDMYCEEYKLFPDVNYYETAEYSDHNNYFFNFHSVIYSSEYEENEGIIYP